jgi:hypothetical protein
VLYLTSFVLPFEGRWGTGALFFLMSFLFMPVVPGFFIIWLANPLFWFGLAFLRVGWWGRTAAVGAAACLLALLPMTGVVERPINPTEPGILLLACAYFAWFAGITLLAIIGTAGWLVEALGPPPRLRLSSLMILIAVVAVALALLPKALWIVRPLFRLPSLYIG